MKTKLISFLIFFSGISLNAQTFEQITFPNESELNTYFFDRYEQVQQAILDNIHNKKLIPYKKTDFKETYQPDEIKERIVDFSAAASTPLNAATVNDLLFCNKITFDNDEITETQVLEGIALSGTMIIHTLYMTDQPLCWLKLSNLKTTLNPNDYAFIVLLNRYKNLIPNKDRVPMTEEIERTHLSGQNMFKCDSNFFVVLSQVFSDQKFFFNEYTIGMNQRSDSQILKLNLYDLQNSKVIRYSDLLKDNSGLYEILNTGDTTFYGEWSLGESSIEHLKFNSSNHQFQSCVIISHSKRNLKYELGKAFIQYLSINTLTLKILEDYHRWKINQKK